MAQIASDDGPVDPEERGLLRLDRADRARGLLLNPPPNKSVAAGTHHPGTEVGEAIGKALEQVMPERCCPQIYKMGMPTVIFGTHPETGQLFIDHSVDTFAAYCGAVKGQDGWGAMNGIFGNLIRATGEINESIFPVRHVCATTPPTPAAPGSGAAVRARSYVKRILAPSQVYTYVVGSKYPMPGIAGGCDGAPNELDLRVGTTARADRRDAWPTAFRTRPASVTSTATAAAAAGAIRSSAIREHVLDDVLDEYVSHRGGARATTASCSRGTLEALRSRDRSTTRRRARCATQHGAAARA